MTVTVTTGVGSWVQRGVHQKVWNSMPYAAGGSIGTDLNAPALSDKTVTVQGTFGASGSVTIVGSNDGTNYDTMHDVNGNALTFTSAGTKALAENPLYIHPSVTVGDGTTALSVTMLSVRTGG